MTRHFDYVDYLLTALLNQMAVHVSLTKTQASSTIMYWLTCADTNGGSVFQARYIILRV